MVLATGVYTIFGGLAAVIYTEFMQAIVLLAGAITLSVLGLIEAGGMSGLRQALPPDFFHMMKPSTDPAFPWTGIFFGAPILGIWYWCTDQMIVQRVLGAKTEEDARGGAILCGLLKILPVFVLVLPGLIARALYPDIKGDDAYPTLVVRLLPTGVIGVMVAALLAALMSSLSATFNSASTLVTLDVYKKLKPGATERQLVTVGRLFTVVMVALGIAWVPFIQYLSTEVYIYLQSVQAYISPPIAAVFLLGVTWPRANRHGAIAALASGAVLRHGAVPPGVESRQRPCPGAARRAAGDDELPALRDPAVCDQRGAAGGRLAGDRARDPGAAARPHVQDPGVVVYPAVGAIAAAVPHPPRRHHGPGAVRDRAVGVFRVGAVTATNVSCFSVSGQFRRTRVATERLCLHYFVCVAGTAPHATPRGAPTPTRCQRLASLGAADAAALSRLDQLSVVASSNALLVQAARCD